MEIKGLEDVQRILRFGGTTCVRTFCLALGVPFGAANTCTMNSLSVNDHVDCTELCFVFEAV